MQNGNPNLLKQFKLAFKRAKLRLAEQLQNQAAYEEEQQANKSPS